ncbi:MAG TPA: DUF2334 domain-containing protein [Candidatus Limnocylindrales bacterium]|nr:DUF2334 domain-containing protein [Candidatus Limnocylindrales bacterium]
MHYVIIRDDDTNAFTPVECLERLYRPFLNAGLPVNLAVIPDVSLNARRGDGEPEGFLGIDADGGDTAVDLGRDLYLTNNADNAVLTPARLAARPRTELTRPINENDQLVRYLHDNPGYYIVQHGCHHDYLEFDQPSRPELAARLDRGAAVLSAAGFGKAQTFVAPYDKLSRGALLEVGRRFEILSTGWFELRRLPYSWWPRYLLKKVRCQPHWRVGRTLLLSHPGCLLSCHRTYSTMMGGIFHHLRTHRLTVLVTHWWEYFRNNKPDEAFIGVLHETASYLASHPNLKVISFQDLVRNRIPMN